MTQEREVTIHVVDEHVVDGVKGNELLRSFADAFRSGAQGACLDCETAKDLAEAIDAVLPSMRDLDVNYRSDICSVWNTIQFSSHCFGIERTADKVLIGSINCIDGRWHVKLDFSGLKNNITGDFAEYMMALAFVQGAEKVFIQSLAPESTRRAGDPASKSAIAQTLLDEDYQTGDSITIADSILKHWDVRWK